MAVYLSLFLHQQWEKMPKGKKENCELGLCQVELATDVISKAGFDRSVKWWKSWVYSLEAYWQHFQAQTQSANL